MSATSKLDNTRLLFTTNGSTVAAKATATANVLTFVGDASANITIAGVADPTSDQQAATKKYVDDTAVPGGSTTQVQFNSSGAFGGISSWTTNGTTTFNGLDNSILSLGTTNDLSITHNATNSIITSNTGDLIIDNTNATGSTINKLGTDTSATSFEVQNTSGILFAVDASGQANFTNNVDATGGVDINADNVSLTIGSGGEFDIKFNGTNTFANSTSGDLIIQNSVSTGDITFLVGSQTTSSQFKINNSNNGTLFNIFGSGDAQFTGNLDCRNGLDIEVDNTFLTIGASSDLTMTYDGSDSKIQSNTGDLIIDNTNPIGSTIIRLGTDTTATAFEVQSNSYTKVLTVDSVGAITATGAMSMGTNKITQLATPTTDSDGATKGYVDSVATGLDWKESCRLTTTGANITLSGNQTIDGVLTVDGNRILVKDQSSGSQNGIYISDSGAWSRSDDMLVGTDASSATVFIQEGTGCSECGFVCTNNEGSAVVGTDALVFTQFNGAANIIAGDGLNKAGNELSVNVDDSSIEISGDALRVKALGVTNAMLTNDSVTVTAGDGLDTTDTVLSLGDSTTLSVDSTVLRTNVEQTITVAKIYDDSTQLRFGSTSPSFITNTGTSTFFRTVSGELVIQNMDNADNIRIALTGTGSQFNVSGSTTTPVATISRTGIITNTNTTDGTSGAGAIYTPGGISCAKNMWAATYLNTSDIRLKTDIEKLDTPLELINQINGYSYKMKNDLTGPTHYGVIAQELEEVLPDLVNTSENDGMKAVYYNGLIPFLIESVKALDAQVKSLQSRLEELEK
jgi:hypothetical protein